MPHKPNLLVKCEDEINRRILIASTFINMLQIITSISLSTSARKRLVNIIVWLSDLDNHKLTHEEKTKSIRDMGTPQIVENILANEDEKYRSIKTNK